MSESAHSEYSASQFEADMLCPGRRVMQRGKPRSSNIYAASGTVMHSVHEQIVLNQRSAEEFIGTLHEVDGFTIEFDADMADLVNTSASQIRGYIAGADMTAVERRVHYGSFIGVDDSKAWGTADVAAMHLERREAFVGDLKTGRSPVSPDSPQLKLYAAGVVREFEDFADIDTVRMAITQPKDSRDPKEYVIQVSELKEWLAGPATQAVRMIQMAEQTFREGDENWNNAFLKPAEKACAWCAAKATCPALRNQVVVSVSAPASASEFESISDPATFTEPDLSRALSKCDLIDDWTKAVRAEVERRLLAGVAVPQFKLVQGKRGNRQWSDPAEVEKTLKSMRLKECEMYDFKLISPTTADKLAKAGTIGPRQWPKLKDLITQTDGRPHVAPVSDPRPALEVTPVIEDFTDVTAEDLA